MKYTAALVSLAGLAAARDISYKALAKREVPQEQSHKAILQIANTHMQANNTRGIIDAVFGLLGDKAANEGKGDVTDLNCLQQAIADQAFTNAKAVDDLEGMANAIMYRALERNTQGVGVESKLCTSETATNPEIAAIAQHQDPASPGAAATNKQIALDVAVQLASIGADPLLAIQTGTFTPGDVNDNTFKGNTCNDENDAVGCIISQNLLVPDVTEAEINEAVGGQGGGTAPPKKNATETDAGAEDDKRRVRKMAARSSIRAEQELWRRQADNDTAPASGAALDFGSCTNPAIAFGPQSDRPGADAFIAANLKDFNHGSANGIGVITGFICQQLGDKCKAAAEVVSACDDAAAAAKELKGQAAADAFNEALGVSA